ncbi:MAG TPA: peptidylprolyl isomerase [Candidatus Kapabacteria bacterium]|jgi:peptidyl-prolyl cis-trans isomerase B (cyclophilin B)
MKKSITYSILSLAVAAILCAAAFTFTHSATATTMTPNSTMTPNASYKPPITGTKLDQYTAHPKRHLVIVTKQGTIKLQLFEKVAPNHVQNIIDLANSHFYDGTYFHRVIPGFMIQGGDPNTKDNDFSNDGTGNNGTKRLMAEFNDIHHVAGILSMARTNDVNSASCQFFICVGDAGFLDHKYTAFGQVIEGMDVVNKIVALPDVTNRPQQAIQQGGANPGKAAEVIKMYVEND